MLKKVIQYLGVSILLITSISSSINTFAFSEVALPGNFKTAPMISEYYAVNNNTVLNARSLDCKLHFSLKPNTILQVTEGNITSGNGAGPKPTVCKIGGKDYNMLPVTSVKKLEIAKFYVAEDFVAKIGTDNAVKTVDSKTFQVKVNSNEGLNIRDFNCKVLDRVANNTVMTSKDLKEVYADAEDEGRNFCRVGGRLYHYNYVEYVKNGKTIKGYAASEFLNSKW